MRMSTILSIAAGVAIAYWWHVNEQRKEADIRKNGNTGNWRLLRFDGDETPVPYRPLN